MKKILWAVAALLIPVVSTWAAASVTVNSSGSGDFTTIQAAINSGATTITITDSTNYVEDVQIGDTLTNGPAVTLTSNQSGTNRPVIIPLVGHNYTSARRSGQLAGFGLFANNSVVSNLIIEAQPDLPAPGTGGGTGAMMIVATNVLIQNCVFQIATNTTGILSATTSPLLFMGQQGDGIGDATPGGPDCNGCVLRNCEFIGVAPDADPLEPTPDGNLGYLGQKFLGTGPGQGSGYVRIDMYTILGEDVFITFDGCWFHHDRDFGIFPTDLGITGGSLTVIVTKCRFDANGKFFIRGRSANVVVQNSVFSRCGQLRSGDSQNAAVAININGSANNLIPSGSVSNCVFVNCGSANYQQAYFAGVNNDSGDLLTVDHCTFVDCLSGVDTGSQQSGGPPNEPTGLGNLSVSNSIFHQIGDNVPRSVEANAVTLTNGSPDLVGGLYPAWTNILANINGSPPLNQFSAVFNHFNWSNSDLMTIGNCLVGSVDTEDTRSWDEARTNLSTVGVIGCRLFAGYDTNFVVGTVTPELLT